MRELTAAFITPGFEGFDRGKMPVLSALASMTSYEASFNLPVAFPKEAVDQGMGQVVTRSRHAPAAAGGNGDTRPR